MSAEEAVRILNEPRPVFYGGDAGKTLAAVQAEANRVLSDVAKKQATWALVNANCHAVSGYTEADAKAQCKRLNDEGARGSPFHAVNLAPTKLSDAAKAAAGKVGAVLNAIEASRWGRVKIRERWETRNRYTETLVGRFSSQADARRLCLTSDVALRLVKITTYRVRK